MKLYHHPLSGHSHRVRLFVSLLGLPHDLIEVDLKRPGRIDVKIPIFPATTPAEGFAKTRPPPCPAAAPRWRSIRELDTLI